MFTYPWHMFLLLVWLYFLSFFLLPSPYVLHFTIHLHFLFLAIFNYSSYLSIFILSPLLVLSLFYFPCMKSFVLEGDAWNTLIFTWMPESASSGDDTPAFSRSCQSEFWIFFFFFFFFLFLYTS